MSLVYLNDQYLLGSEAKVSVYDRGYLFGEGVYEVIAGLQGQLAFAHEHLERLKHNLGLLGIQQPSVDFFAIFNKLIAKNHLSGEDFSLYVHVSRGAQSLRSHSYPEALNPTVFCDIQATRYPDYETFSNRRVITVNDQRWQLSHIKSSNLLANTLALHKAERLGACEAILLREGKVIEGSRSNLFIVRDHSVYTPPASPYLVSGITREVVLQLLRRLKIPHHETSISRNDLWHADEVWLTGTSRHICPISQVDDHILTRESYGPLWQRVFCEYKKALLQSQQAISCHA